MTYVPPKYPGEIPTEEELFPWIDDEHYVSVEKFTAIVKELRAALIELGTNPAGAYDTVKDWLTDLATAAIPAGLIAMWSGTLANIPTGWALCDGQDGRPDLKSKFVKGAAASVNPGGAGGATTHDHTVDSHDHSLPSHTHGRGSYAAPAHTHGAGSYYSELPLYNFNVGDYTAYAYEYDLIPLKGTSASGGAGAITGISAAGGSGKSGVASPGTNSKNHEPPYYEVAYIIKT